MRICYFQAVLFSQCANKLDMSNLVFFYIMSNVGFFTFFFLILKLKIFTNLYFGTSSFLLCVKFFNYHFRYYFSFILYTYIICRLEILDSYFSYPFINLSFTSDIFSFLKFPSDLPLSIQPYVSYPYTVVYFAIL